jgi:hypothetical protein
MTYSASLTAILLLIAPLVIGLVLLYGARQKWRWLIDPPEWLFLLYSHSLLKVLFGRNFLLYFTYFLGFAFLLVGIIDSFRLVHILFSDGISIKTLLPVDDGANMRPPSAGQRELEILLKAIAGYLNALFISVLFLVGLRRKWFLRGTPPIWLKFFLKILLYQGPYIFYLVSLLFIPE